MIFVDLMRNWFLFFFHSQPNEQNLRHPYLAENISNFKWSFTYLKGAAVKDGHCEAGFNVTVLYAEILSCVFASPRRLRVWRSP